MGRAQVVKEFREWAVPILADRENLKIGLVGGSPKDPELRYLPDNLGNHLIYLGIDPSVSETFMYQDLNLDNQENEPNFDLLICSQVLEHLWNTKEAFSNFNRLLKPGGHLWIACPASNFVHGSPDYYSAGYSTEMLEKLGGQTGFAILKSGFSGTKREYLSRHLLHIWFHEKHLERIGFIRFGTPSNFVFKFWFNFLTLPSRLVLALSTNEELGDPMFACESWSLQVKIRD
jgi:SAM-dependent methyltransferase